MPFHFNNERRRSSGSFNRERRASGEQIRELMENSVADMEKRGSFNRERRSSGEQIREILENSIADIPYYQAKKNKFQRQTNELSAAGRDRNSAEDYVRQHNEAFRQPPRQSSDLSEPRSQDSFTQAHIPLQQVKLPLKKATIYTESPLQKNYNVDFSNQVFKITEVDES